MFPFYTYFSQVTNNVLEHIYMKVLTIIGARPQFIKAATVSRVIKVTPDVEEVIVHTGQHFDKNMSDIFFEEMDIPKPDYMLNISSLGHGAMTGRMLEQVEAVLVKEQPDWVLVYGDTNSTLAGALAASKLHIKVAHVEAGLRSHNFKMPEEQNRILTDRLSSILFTPTQIAVDNLETEGYGAIGTQIETVGDVMYDAAMYYQKKSVKPSWFDSLNTQGDFILATIHRAENTDNNDRLTEIVAALNELAKTKQVIMPLHPRTKNKLEQLDINLEVTVVDPVGYLDMVYLLENCAFVASDSGGLQKEAYFFGKPCLVLRDETEWLELVEHGTNKIVGANKAKILEAAEQLNLDLDFSTQHYGDGKAAERIVNNLIEFSQGAI